MTKAIIIGGGMGGLTAALSLQQQGVQVEVHEQADVLREVGAGLTLSKSSIRGFHSLGLFDAIRRASEVSAGIPFVHFRTGEVLWGAPAVAAPGFVEDPFVSRHMYRADLQAILAEALEKRAPGSVHLGHALVGWSQEGDQVVAQFANGDRATGDFLVGADGLHSAVRKAHWSAAPPVFTGQVAWRFLLDGDAAAPYLSTGPGAVFFGPDRIVNRYLLRHGEILNCVAIVRTPEWAEEGWSIRGDPAELAGLFADFHPDVRAILSLADPSRLFKWALAAHPPLPTWLSGRVALLGDAAHPMLPFLGMGAAMAIEDGVVLGRAMQLNDEPIAGLAAYEATRRVRTVAMGEASARQGRMLQAQDPNDFKGLDTPLADRSLFDYDPSTVSIATLH